MKAVLDICAGLFWTTTYVLIIHRGVADRTYGMPLVALAANLSWEFIFLVLQPTPFPRVIALVWLILDIAIFYTFLRFGPREFPRLSRPTFAGMTGLTVILAFSGIWFVSMGLDHGQGAYAAFMQNLMMSALFVGMLLHRGSTRGQSSLIALTKLLGTAFASAAAGFYDIAGRDKHLMIYLFLSIFVLDLVYLIAVSRLEGRERSALRQSPTQSE